ncbi:hypothetical protein PPERSA_11123 [Pseudocohnilembus persalinus]|uniref:Uncharacterized protein n=1 Tax=Pseudocohnilembus persalinus TaxID=266149 RepID=A0A0V0QZ95_PSEPJ|nr:hypothetical protein PPERSA_11123 [Pseudocohnilembus persalinus]|eukprot:KRX07574.1 hypothetical protein PPERSA_11123 [Pseudocohnilembus persalinus]
MEKMNFIHDKENFWSLWDQVQNQKVWINIDNYQLHKKQSRKTKQGIKLTWYKNLIIILNQNYLKIYVVFILKIGQRMLDWEYSTYYMKEQSLMCIRLKIIYDIFDQFFDKIDKQNKESAQELICESKSKNYGQQLQMQYQEQKNIEQE